MRKFFIGCLILLLSVALAFIGGSIWWSLWMNRGWPGSPGLLAHLLGADGEYAYNAIELEMSVIVWIVIACLGAFTYLRFRNRRSKG